MWAIDWGCVIRCGRRYRTRVLVDGPLEMFDPARDHKENRKGTPPGALLVLYPSQPNIYIKFFLCIASLIVNPLGAKGEVVGEGGLYLGATTIGKLRWFEGESGLWICRTLWRMAFTALNDQTF